jgi:hypothetical protein
LGARDRDGCHCVRFQRVFEVFKSGCASHHRPSPFPVLDLLLQASIRIATIGAEVCLTNPYSVFFSSHPKKESTHELHSFELAIDRDASSPGPPRLSFLVFPSRWQARFLSRYLRSCMEGNGGDRPYGFVVFMSLGICFWIYSLVHLCKIYYKILKIYLCEICFIFSLESDTSRISAAVILRRHSSEVKYMHK